MKFPRLRILGGIRTVGLLWLLYCFFALSDAGVGILIIALTFVLGGLWMLVWLTRLGMRLYKSRSRKGARLSARWVIEPLFVIGCVALAAAGPMASLRLWVSTPALEAYATDVRQGKVKIDYDGRYPTRVVGLYLVGRTELLGDGTVRFITSSSGVLDQAGFAYSPSSPPPRQGEDFYSHLFGNWWRWRESW